MRRLLTAAFLVVFALVASSVSEGEPGQGSDRILTRVTFIHFRKGHAKPPWAGGGENPGKKEEEGYYTYLAKGTKWREIEDVRLNPESDNLELNPSELGIAICYGMTEWETAGSQTLSIFGNVEPDFGVTYDDGNYRGFNTISFGTYPDPGVIAITTVWGYFSGPPSQREIIETHILFNDGDFVWGDAETDSTLMDVQNIATHELGHCAGMGDLYLSAASEETMYGYSQEGETKKRDLDKGDETGIINLYK